jgi:pimeloyl-ACP methyl ester carboxylesterase
MILEPVVIDVRRGEAHEAQSGLQMLHPRIWGALRRPARARVAAVIIHPTSNFMAHYLLEPLAARGIATLGLNTRYQGSDVALLLERAIQDLGAGVRWLRARGFERILLIGNSGGGALVSFYQAQAEHLDLMDTPAGDPIGLTAQDLPAADAIALNAAHLGRSRLFECWIDPAVIDETDLMATDPTLDMFNPANGPPYSAEFIARYRGAQKARVQRLEEWVRAKLRQLRAAAEGPRDMAFVVHRTLADLRCLDPTLDRNDRTPGTTLWGPPREQNYAANSVGRYTSLTAFLSQWAPCSRGDGPTNLARTSVPVLLVEHTADSSTFPSDHDTWSRAAAGRISRHQLKGGTHYLTGQPALVTELVEAICGFAGRL